MPATESTFTVSTVPLETGGSLTLTAPPTAVLGVGLHPLEVGRLMLSDPGATAGEIISITRTATTGEFFENYAPSSNNNTLTLSGSVSEINNALSHVLFEDDVAGTENIALTAADSLGHTASLTIAATVNGVPTITAPASFVVTSDSVSPFPVSISESGDVAGETFFLEISDPTGYVGISTDEQPGFSDHLLYASGTVDQLNAELKTLEIDSYGVGHSQIVIQVFDPTGNETTADIPLATGPLLQISSLIQGFLESNRAAISSVPQLLNFTGIQPPGIVAISGTSLIAADTPASVFALISKLSNHS